MSRAWAISFVLFASTGHADEIVRRGEIVHGTLVLNGRMELRGTDGKVLASGAELGRMTLTPTAKLFRDGPAHVVTLSREEQVTGVFVKVEKGVVVLRTAWAERVAVPKEGVVSLTHLPGWRTLTHEDFGGKATTLTKAEQAISVPVTGKVVAGRVSVLFREVDPRGDGRWLLEAEFASRTVRITFAGEGPGVDAGGLRGTAYPVKRSSEARKLTLAFSPGSFRISCDDEALWSALEVGPGPLTRVRVVYLGGTSKVEIAGLTVEAAEPMRRRPPGDPTRDELWLARGDQLFGDVKRADSQGIAIAGKFGTRSYAWKELRGWFPRPSDVVPRKIPKGIEVRMEIHSGLRAERDVLRGVLTALDAKNATLHHRLLGELILPRTRIAAIEEQTRP